MRRVIVPVVFILAVVFFCASGRAHAEDNAMIAYYSLLKQAMADGVVTSEGAAGTKKATMPDLTGSWGSTGIYSFTVKVIQNNSNLSGIVEVPDVGGGINIYHASGIYYNNTIMFSQASDTGFKFFQGTLNGTTITGNLMLYDQNMQYSSTISGVTLSKQIPSGDALTSAPIAGSWSTSLLGKNCSATLTVTPKDAVGETVDTVTGVLTVDYGNGPVPYHCTGYYLNSGELFLYNTSGNDVRTFLGVKVNGQLQGRLEQDAVVASSNLALHRLVPLAPVMMLENQQQ